MDSVELFAIPAAPEAEPLPLPVPDPTAKLQACLDALGCPPGIYTALRTFDGQRFLCLEEHFDRTDRSMALAGWEDSALDRTRVRHALRRLVRDPPAGAEDWNLRLDVLPPGASLPGTHSRLLLGRWPHREVPAEFLEHGVRLGIAERLERFRPRIKEAEFAKRRHPYPLVTRDAYDHVMLDEDRRILEATSANVYLIQQDSLRTAGAGVLEGITRRLVFELAEAQGLTLDLEPPPLSAVAEADEAFLSSSLRGIVPVVGIGETVVGRGVPGPRTRRLATDLLRTSRERARPA